MAADIPSLEALYGPSGYTWYHGSNMHDVNRAQQSANLAATQANTQATALSNLFNERTLDDRVLQQQLNTELAGHNTKLKQLDADIETDLFPWRKDAKLREYVQQAKKSELDELEYKAQKMAYSLDPKEREQGLMLMQMHKDFVKLREQSKLKKEEINLQHSNSMALEKERQSGRIAAKQASAKGVQDVFTAVQSGKVSPANAAAAFGSAALQAQAQGDMESFAEYQRAAQVMEQLAISSRPDTGAGKPDLGAMGVPTRPKQGSAFSQQATPSWEEVQKAYPNADQAKLREWYLKKYRNN